jgi:hypothetical protein
VGWGPHVIELERERVEFDVTGGTTDGGAYIEREAVGFQQLSASYFILHTS